MPLDLASMGIDVPALETAIGSTVTAALASELSAEADDLKEFGLHVAKNGLAAFLAGNELWKGEVKAQALGLLEKARIRAETVDWGLVQTIVGIAVHAALNGALSMIPGGGLIPELSNLVTSWFGGKS